MNQDEGPDDKGATEDEFQRVEDVQGGEALGYTGGAREEHSGENEPRDDGDPAEKKDAP